MLKTFTVKVVEDIGVLPFLFALHGIDGTRIHQHHRCVTVLFCGHLAMYHSTDLLAVMVCHLRGCFMPCMVSHT